MFFELLTGVKPFGGKSLGESMLNMERRGPTDICGLNPEITPELKAVIEKALAYEPEGRHADVATFQRAIAELGGPIGPNGGRIARADETVVAPLVSSPAVSPPPASPPSPSPAEGLVEPAPLAIELLAEVEHDLAAFIGPIAKSAVRRAARSTVDVGALYQTLAGYIDGERDRESFIYTGQRRAAASGRNQVSAGSQASLGQNSGISRPTAAISISPDALRRLESDLTVYIGPIASVVLRKLLSKSSSLPDFYRDLAAYIPNERDRSRLLDSRLSSTN